MSAQARRLQKINNTLLAISQNNWVSLNDFLLAFYTSNDPHIAQRRGKLLGYKENTVFAPEMVLDAWLEHGPPGESRKHLQLAITRKAAEIMVKESTQAYRRQDLHVPSSKINASFISTDFGLNKLSELFQTILPCLWLLLTMLLLAPNDYEKKKGVEKDGKEKKASRIAVVIISMLLFGRNQATDAFQLVMGIFLSSAGAGQRVIDVCNHLGLSVSYKTVQRSLKTLTEDARSRAQQFISLSERLFAIVYDNINFTWRKAAQRLDSATEQINATTSAVFALPAKFTYAAYKTALMVSERNKLSGKRAELTLQDLLPSESANKHLTNVFHHAIRTILLNHCPSLKKPSKRNKKLCKRTRDEKPKVRVLEGADEKTEFFPLPAIQQEEASVQGTIKVLEKLFTKVLNFAEAVIGNEIRLIVGDWLSIRNLRLVKDERAEESEKFAKMDWIQEAAMPFHFQLNAMYMLCRTHLGYPGDNDPSSLEHHRTILRRRRLDTKKPEFNVARELVEHSLIARILDCTRIVLERKAYGDLQDWHPKWKAFNEVVSEIVQQFTTTASASAALHAGDDVLAHSIFFIRDSLTFWEFSDAIRDADVGRMWYIYDLWIFMMRGAGCHNYGNEILEMKAQFKYELPELLWEVVERTWLVNRWGKTSRSIPTDLYLEHNNGFIKNLFAAMGSAASMDFIQTKASACVEVLRDVTHEMSKFCGLKDYRRGHKDVTADEDIRALCMDLKETEVHKFTLNRRVPPPPNHRAKGDKKSAVRDILLDGMQALAHKNLFQHWMNRTGKGGTEIFAGDSELSEDMEGIDDDDGLDESSQGLRTGTAFDNPNGHLEVDIELDQEFSSEHSTIKSNEL